MTVAISCTDRDDCKKEPLSDCVCTYEYNPVCGCDDVTYGNPCDAACHGVQSFTLGACPE